MMGRLLCWLGRHRWVKVTFVYGQWTECDRCHVESMETW